MPYRFKRSENIRKGFRRIAGEQVDVVVRQLGASAVTEKSVHASRKALKRLRALIRCAAPALGAKVAARHDTAIRDIARLLSQRRDADVRLNTLTTLEAHFGSEAAKILAPLKTALESARAAPDGGPDVGSDRAPDNAARDTLGSDVLDDVRRRLVKEGKRLRSAQLKGRDIAPFIEGAARSYRDGMKARKTAYRKPSDENFHDLRKAVQTHWRHMALLQRAWPEAFAARVSLAREISELLGDDHDLAMLKSAAAGMAEAERVSICNLCERRQSELRADAKVRTKLLYCEPAKAFERRITAYWAIGSKVRPLNATIEPGADTTLAAGAGGVGSPPSLAAKTPATSPSQRRA